ncbi:MAG: type II toxin-antitoxin system HicB family antitoxin [Candidatus Chromulinivorax sp.]|nr:type II toxin-antitoxin system HicB family antitoxin [Candidatus Chromulinivorax sp.]
MMKYKGYLGVVQFDDEAKIFHGDVVGLKDVITFQGTSVEELEKAFKDSIDDYVAWCAERNENPEKTFSGKLHLRMKPELHADLAAQALQQKVSLNDLIIAKLSQ